MFSATNVNHFKLSNIHSNNDKSKTSKQLKKSAQLVETFTRYEFSTLKSPRNNSKTTIWRFYSSKIKISRIFSRTNRMLISTKTNDDLNKNFLTIVESHEYHAIQNQKMIKNSHLTKLTENQSKYIVSLTFRRRELSTWQTKSYLNFKKSILFHKKNVDFVKVDHEKNNRINSTIESIDHFRSISHFIMKISINSNSNEFFTTNSADNIIKHCRKKSDMTNCNKKISSK